MENLGFPCVFIISQRGKSCQINEERKMCLEVKIPKEVRSHRETIFFGLSARQFFCSALAVGTAAGVYLGLGPILGKEPASWLCMILATPLAVAGFFSYNGMKLEQFAWAVVKSQVLKVGVRVFVSENFLYKALCRKEGQDFD